MLYTGYLVALLATCSTLGCGVDSDFTESESQALFSSANSQLHTLHGVVQTDFGIEQWPTTYSHPCPDGGTIEMVTTVNADNEIKELLHTMVDCVLDGRTLNGNLDYLDIESVACGENQGFAFDIDGNLSVVGGDDDGTCAMDARESCGNFTGKTCGYDV